MQELVLVYSVYRVCVLCVSLVMIHPKIGSCVQCVQSVYRACVLCVSQVMIHSDPPLSSDHSFDFV